MEIPSPLEKLRKMNKREKERFRERETDSGGLVKGHEEFICGGLV